MQSMKLAKQIINFNKSAFENSFNTMVLLQEQMERAQKGFLERAAGVPAEIQKGVNEWATLYKKSRDDFKKVVDEGFTSFESYFANVSGSNK